MTPPSAPAGPRGSEPEGWRYARLIPTYGTRSQQEQEKRATSSLLAVIHGVPEFGHALLRELGAPKAPMIETFAEVRLKDADGKTVIPDGAIRCQRAGKAWTCLVEVKTGSARLRDDQVASYLDVGRENGFDGVLTISPQITSEVRESPVAVDKRKLKSTALWHLSWWRILTVAVVQQRARALSAWRAENKRRVRAADDPDAVEVLEPITLHEARHSAASYLIEAGLNDLELTSMIGHSDPRTTKAIYGHLFPDSPTVVTAKLDAYLSASNG